MKTLSSLVFVVAATSVLLLAYDQGTEASMWALENAINRSYRDSTKDLKISRYQRNICAAARSLNCKGEKENERRHEALEV